MSLTWLVSAIRTQVSAAGSSIVKANVVTAYYSPSFAKLLIFYRLMSMPANQLALHQVN